MRLKKITLGLGSVAAIVTGAEISSNNDIVREHYLNAVNNFQTAKADYYLQSASTIIKNEGVKKNGCWKWEKKNICISIGDNEIILSVIEDSKNLEDTILRFSLHDENIDGSVNKVAIEYVTSVPNGIIYSKELYAEEKYLTPFQYHYARFLELFSERRIDLIEKEFPSPAKIRISRWSKQNNSLI